MDSTPCWITLCEYLCGYSWYHTMWIACYHIIISYHCYLSATQFALCLSPRLKLNFLPPYLLVGMWSYLLAGISKQTLFTLLSESWLYYCTRDYNIISLHDLHIYILPIHSLSTLTRSILVILSIVPSANYILNHGNLIIGRPEIWPALCVWTGAKQTIVLH